MNLLIDLEIKQKEILFLQAEFVNGVFTYAASFCSLGLSDLEIGLFCAMVLFTSDRPGLADCKTVEQLQATVMEALKHLVSYWLCTNRLRVTEFTGKNGIFL